MRHRATPRFWLCYRQLSEDVQRLADKCYALLRQDPHHPSLRLKKVGRSGLFELVYTIERSPWRIEGSCFGSGLARTRIMIGL